MSRTDLLILHTGLDDRETREFVINDLLQLDGVDAAILETGLIDDIEPYRPAIQALTATPPFNADAIGDTVLAAEKLEFLLEYSAQLQMDGRDTLESLIFSGGGDVVDEDLAALVESISATSTAQPGFRRLVGIIDGVASRIGPERLSTTSQWDGSAPVDDVAQTPRNVVTEVKAEVEANKSDHPDLALAHDLLQRVETTCTGSLLKLNIDGDTDFAVFLYTRTTIDGHPVDQFTGLLDPGLWPTHHSFWQAMEPIAAKGPQSDLHEDEVQELLDRCQGAAPGLHWERVGFTAGQDLFHNTFLCFTEFPQPNGGSILSYALMPARGSALIRDNGALELTSSGAADTEVLIVKTLFLSQRFGGGDSQTEGQIIAKYACVFGWADQTRLFIANAIGP